MLAEVLYDALAGVLGLRHYSFDSVQIAQRGVCTTWAPAAATVTRLLAAGRSLEEAVATVLAFAVFLLLLGAVGYRAVFAGKLLVRLAQERVYH